MVNAALQQPPIDSGPNWGRHPTSYNSQHDESGVAQRGAARFLRRNSEASICRDAYREFSVGWWTPMPGEYRPAQEVAGVPRKTHCRCGVASFATLSMLSELTSVTVTQISWVFQPIF